MLTLFLFQVRGNGEILSQVVSSQVSSWGKFLSSSYAAHMLVKITPMAAI